MGRLVVMLVDPRKEADVEVVEGGNAAHVIEAPLAQRAPESLHFTAGRGIVGLGVDQGSSEASGCQSETLSPIGRPVVQVEDVGRPVPSKGPYKESQQIDLALLVHGFDGQDITRGIVHESMDANGARFTVQDNWSPMADVPMP